MYIESSILHDDKFASPGIQFDITGGKRKRNILIINQRQHIKEIGKPLIINVLSTTQIDCLKNIIKHVDEFEKERLPSLLFVLDIEDNAVSDYDIKILNKFIIKNDIDIVLCAGLVAAASLVDQTPYRTSQLRGRILEGKLCVPIIPTFALRMIMSDESIDWKTHVNLLGYFKEDLCTACMGKNRYTIRTDIEYTIIDTMDAWKTFYKKLKKAPIVSFDTEGKNLNRRFDNIIYIMQFGVTRDHSYIVPLHHSRTPFSKEERKIISTDVKRWLEYANHCMIITQNGKYDFTISMSFLKVEYIAASIYDLSVAEYFLDENRKYMRAIKISKNPVGQARGKPAGIPAFALETFMAQYTGGFPYDDSTIGKNDRMNLNDYPLKKVAPYCARDTIYIWRVMECQIAEAKRRGGFYNKFMINVTCLGASMQHIFTEMESNGILVDRDYLNSAMLANAPMRKELKKLEQKIYEFGSAKAANKYLLGTQEFQGTSSSLLDDVPWVFNINIKKHAQALFIQMMQLRPLRRTKNGDAAIDKKFKAAYKNYGEVMALDDLGKLQKIFNTYFKGISKILKFNADSQDSRISAYYDFLAVVTTRTSAEKPGLQQIPSHGSIAKLIKRAFLSGWLGIMLKVDYNAHEVRIWGNLSRDKIIAKAFLVGMKIRRDLRIWQANNFDLAYESYEHLTKIGWYRKTDKAKDIKEYTVEEKETIARNLPKKFRYLAYSLIELQKNGDVHKRNYEFFFGTPAAQVTEVQRQSVKNTVFGAMYGKCLVGVTILQTSGGFITLKQLWDQYHNTNKEINIKTSKVATHKGYGHFTQIMKRRGKTWKLTTNYGDKLQGLPDHKLWGLTPQGNLDFIELNKLSKGNWITKSVGTKLFANKIPKFNYDIPEQYKNTVYTIPKKLTLNISTLFGLFVAEGYYKKGEFSNKDIFILDEFSKKIKIEFNAYCPAMHSSNNVNLRTELTLFFNHYLGEVKSAERFIPDIIKRAPKKYQVAFLQGLFEGDGTVYKHQSSWLVEYTTISETLAYDVKLLLENMGIICLMRSAYKVASNTTDKRKVLTYNVRIINQYIKVFVKEVGFYPGHNKQTILEQATQEIAESFAANPHCDSLCQSNYIPPSRALKELFEALDSTCRATTYISTYEAAGVQKNRVCYYKLGAITGSTHTQLKIAKGQGITRYAYAKIKEQIIQAPESLFMAIKTSKRIQALFKEVDCIASYNWMQVEHSAKTGLKEDVYDLVVPGTNSYHVQGFIGHNTGETLGEDLNEAEVRQIKMDNPTADHKELRELLKPYHDMGITLIDKMFSTFKQGYSWILEKQAEARKFYRTVSPIGPVRHLWIYFLTHRSLNNRADRLASNSLNQGLASNLGYIGAREFQTLKFMAKKAGTDLTTKIVNMVHDSLENEVYLIVNLPFVLYYLEHSLMTRTAKVAKDLYGFEMMIGLEAEFEIGMYLSNLSKYGFTEFSFFNIIHTWIEEQEKHFKKTIPRKENLLRYLKEAYRLVETNRGKELARVQKYEPETRILLTLDQVAKFKEQSTDLYKFMKAVGK